MKAARFLTECCSVCVAFCFYSVCIIRFSESAYIYTEIMIIAKVRGYIVSGTYKPDMFLTSFFRYKLFSCVCVVYMKLRMR